MAFKGVLPKELFAPTKSLAANLGLYNGFLAAGLIWTFFISDEIWSKNISIFFLLVFIAGVYGTNGNQKNIICTSSTVNVGTYFCFSILILNFKFRFLDKIMWSYFEAEF